MGNRSVWKGLAAAAGVALAARAALGYWRRYPVRAKVVLVTGSSRGLGLALAEQFARAGARVVLTARDEAELAAARALLIERGAARDEDLLALRCDVREMDQVERLVAEIEARWGAVDVAVNNAGVISVGPVDSQPLSAFRDAIGSNYLSMVHVSLAVMPAMISRGNGAIVNITSIGGKVAVPHLLPYTGSKFAAVGFSQGLHVELRAKGIRVTTVVPGLLRTGSPRNALFVGQREKEFSWFNLGDSLPGISRNAAGAAQRIVRATEAGETEISITPQAAMLARVAQLSPALSAALLTLVERTLPAAESSETVPLKGEYVDEKDIAPLTAPGRAAEQEWNQGVVVDRD